MKREERKRKKLAIGKCNGCGKTFDDAINRHLAGTEVGEWAYEDQLNFATCLFVYTKDKECLCLDCEMKNKNQKRDERKRRK